MLINVTITKALKGVAIGSRIIAAENAVKIKTVGTGASFYLPSVLDRRDSPVYMEVSDSLATLQTAVDAAYESLHVLLPVHPGQDTSVAAVNESFPVNKIEAVAYAPDSANKSWVYAQFGAFKIKKLLVDLTLAEIVTLATQIP